MMFADVTPPGEAPTLPPSALDQQIKAALTDTDGVTPGKGIIWFVLGSLALGGALYGISHTTGQQKKSSFFGGWFGFGKKKRRRKHRR